MTTLPNPPGLSRRALLLGAGGVALTLAGCNASARTREPAGPASSTAAGFSYTDARGKKIELPTVPTVVVAQSSAAAALWDFGFKVKGAYGELKTTDGKLDFQAGNLELSEITVIGSTYGEFNLEKYAAMGPQLLIDESFDDKTLWYVPQESAAKIEAVAPTLGIKMLDLNQLQIIESFGKLAAMLGADINSEAVAAVEGRLRDRVSQGQGSGGRSAAEGAGREPGRAEGLDRQPGPASRPRVPRDSRRHLRPAQGAAEGVFPRDQLRGTRQVQRRPDHRRRAGQGDPRREHG